MWSFFRFFSSVTFFLQWYLTHVILITKTYNKHLSIKAWHKETRLRYVSWASLSSIILKNKPQFCMKWKNLDRIWYRLGVLRASLFWYTEIKGSSQVKCSLLYIAQTTYSATNLCTGRQILIFPLGFRCSFFSIYTSCQKLIQRYI